MNLEEIKSDLEKGVFGDAVIIRQLIRQLIAEVEQLQAEIEQLKAELVAQANDIELAIMIANEAGKAEALESVQPVLDAAKECYRQTNNQPKTEYNDMVLAVAGACAVVNDAYKKYMEE